MNDQNSLQEATNGWQNIGICMKFARENVPFKLRTLWMELVADSFGYGYKTTKRMSQTDMAKKYGFGTRQALSEQLKKLEDLNLIKVKDPNKYLKGGGTEPSAYSPCYPEGYGKIYIKDDTSSGSESKKQIEPEIVVKKVEYDKNENVDF